MVKWYTIPELQSHHDNAFQSRKPGTRTFPPGHDERSFQRVLEEFRAIVGGENVVADDRGLASFRDPYPLFEEGFEASAGIWLDHSFNFFSPGSLTQVIAVQNR